MPRRRVPPSRKGTKVQFSKDRQVRPAGWWEWGKAIKNLDMVCSARTLVFIALVTGVTVFLFYPDFTQLMGQMERNEGKNNGRGHVRTDRQDEQTSKSVLNLSEDEEDMLDLEILEEGDVIDTENLGSDVKRKYVQEFAEGVPAKSDLEIIEADVVTEEADELDELKEQNLPLELTDRSSQHQGLEEQNLPIQLTNEQIKSLQFTEERNQHLDHTGQFEDLEFFKQNQQHTKPFKGIEQNQHLEQREVHTKTLREQKQALNVADVTSTRAKLAEGEKITFKVVGDSISHVGSRPQQSKISIPSNEVQNKDASDKTSKRTFAHECKQTQDKQTAGSNCVDTKTESLKMTTTNREQKIHVQQSKTSSQTGNEQKIHVQQSKTSSQTGNEQKIHIQQSKTSSQTVREIQEEPPNEPEEIQNFKASYLTQVKAKKIFADGRRIPPVELLPQKSTNSSVRVYLFNEFLSETECDGLRRVHDKHVREMTSQPPLLCFDSLNTLRKHLNDAKKNIQVTHSDFVRGTRCVNASFSLQLGKWLAGNWSYSTAFYPGESRFSTVFASRVYQAMGLSPENGGKFQITSYPTGKAYKAHTDCILDGTDLRDRVATVLVYLDDVQEGGETRFPELGIWVKPKKGRALVWNNMSPGGVCEPSSLHVASKVIAGSKYVLIRWYYYKSFYSLGKRPPEPSLPSRSPGQPRVSCDDYDNGSCRWYDEWNNDHLIVYEDKKYTLI